MRLITYLFAVGLLWAIASSGPATPTASADTPPQLDAARASAAPRAADSAHRR